MYSINCLSSNRSRDWGYVEKENCRKNSEKGRKIHPIYRDWKDQIPTIENKGI